jgi:hypothetical protein
MISYDSVSGNARKLRQLTSLDENEFSHVLSYFAPICERYFYYHTYEGKKRILPRFKPQVNEKLPTSQDKLFFILFYLKTYPLYAVQAATFSMSEGKASTWINILQKLLDETLTKMKLAPCQDNERLYHVLLTHPERTFTHDATERPIARKEDKHAQEEEYSGKKKCHTIKNEILVDDASQILYASPTYDGKTHDKALCDEENLHLPAGICLRQDAGYQGYKPIGVHIVQPTKKPRGKDLSTEQKIENQKISKKRVVVEHALAGVKRIRTLKDQLRSRCYELRERVFRLGCSLHNLRVKSPSRKYCPRTGVWAL